MKSLSLALLFSFLPGVSVAEQSDCVPPNEAEIRQIIDTFKMELRDNESVRLEGVCRHTLTKGRKVPTVVYCGMLNAKNAFGAYAGYQPFYSVPQTGGAGFFQDSSSLPGVPDFAYCLGCMLPEKTPEECSQIRINAIKASQ